MHITYPDNDVGNFESYAYLVKHKQTYSKYD